MINTRPTGLLGAARPQLSGEGSLMSERLQEEAWRVPSHYVFQGGAQGVPSGVEIVVATRSQPAGSLVALPLSACATLPSALDVGQLRSLRHRVVRAIAVET